jgi:opacity protein-like surface antigen
VRDEVRDAVPAFFKVDLESPVGVQARVGYRFLPHLAGEVQFQWFAKANVELEDPDENTMDAYKLESLNLTGNLKAYLLTGRIQPFVLAGAGFMHLNGDDKVGLGLRTSGDDFAARFGGGIDFYLNRNFVAVLEGGYILPTGKLDDFDHVTWSAGIQYRF